MPLLEIKNLHTYFKTKKGIVKAVNDVSYSLEAGKTLGIVGESGSGKSVSSMSILNLLDGNGYIADGEILFEVTKPANRQTENNGIDAISGATITSQALGVTLNQWFGFYKNYLVKNAVTEVEDVVLNVEPDTVEE